jgi:hypothetical protein
LFAFALDDVSGQFHAPAHCQLTTHLQPVEGGGTASVPHNLIDEAELQFSVSTHLMEVFRGGGTANLDAIVKTKHSLLCQILNLFFPGV